MAFATTTQYRAKYKTDLIDAELTVWLADASDIMAAELDRAGIDYTNPSEGFAARLCRVCRDMVHRAIGDGSASAMSIPYGSKQASMSAGGYSESFTMANPYGDLFIKDKERQSLGITRGGFAVAVPSYGNAVISDD